jgi:hypothetical protein
MDLGGVRTTADFEEPFVKQESSGSDCVDLARPRFRRETLEAMTSLSETFFRRASFAESLTTLSISSCVFT